MFRTVALSAIMVLCVFAVQAQTKLIDGILAERTESRWTLKTNQGSYVFALDPSIRCWRDRKSVKSEAFMVGDALTIRCRTASDPPIAREICDKASAGWLAKIRSETLSASFKAYDGKRFDVTFEDGFTFSYRATDKSVVSMKSKEGAKLSDFKAGDKLFVRGRLLPNYDTFLVSVSDQPGTVKSAAAGSPTKSKQPAALPKAGTVGGVIERYSSDLNLVDVKIGEWTYAFTITSSTKITLEGKTVPPTNLKPGSRVSVRYRKDTLGRLISDLIELTT